MRNAVLVIEPEEASLLMLCNLLKRQGYEVWKATTLAEGLNIIRSIRVLAVLLELDLPDGDGLELIQRVRAETHVRLLVVSHRSSEQDTVDALNGGANDYVVKPFRPNELLARLRVALRPKADGGGFEIGALRVLPAQRRVYLKGKEVALTPTEFDVLHVMARQAGRVVPHRQLLRDVWGATKKYDSNYLRVFVYQLRQKLERDPCAPELLLTTPRIGYRLKVSN